MPLSIQIPARGDQYLYQGIAGAGHAIADGIESMQRNLKQAKAYRAMAVDGLGMDPDQVDKMSLGELQGHLQAVSVKNAIEQTKAAAEDRQAQAQQRLARAAAIQEAQRQSAEMQGFAQDYADGPPAGSAEGGVRSAESADVDPGGEGDGSGAVAAPAAALSHQQRLLYALGRHPAAFGTPQFDNSVGSLQKLATTGAGISPQAWQSPQGNPYVFLDHTLMPDKAPTDMSSLAAGVPEGYELVPTGGNKSQLVKTKKDLPASFHSTLDKVMGDIGDAESVLAQPDSSFKDADEAKSRKAAKSRVLDKARRTGQATIDRYHSTGFLNDAQRDSMYQSLGIGAAPGAGAAGSGGASSVGAAPKVGTVVKGYKFKGGDPASKNSWEKQ